MAWPPPSRMIETFRHEFLKVWFQYFLWRMKINLRVQTNKKRAICIKMSILIHWKKCQDLSLIEKSNKSYVISCLAFLSKKAYFCTEKKNYFSRLDLLVLKWDALLFVKKLPLIFRITQNILFLFSSNYFLSLKHIP